MVLNFLQGQDSLLLLLVMTLAVAEMKQGRDFTAGCLLGCGLFKFHVILSFVLLVASQGRKGSCVGLPSYSSPCYYFQPVFPDGVS